MSEICGFSLDGDRFSWVCEWGFDDLSVRLVKDGLLVEGGYESAIQIGPVLLTWEELDEARTKLFGRREDAPLCHDIQCAVCYTDEQRENSSRRREILDKMAREAQEAGFYDL